MNVYETCPVFITPRFNLRLTCREDVPGLLKVYSDSQAQPYFNADNCTSRFRYRTMQEMEDCVNIWVWSYEHGYFVRWTILQGETPVGTVEMFRRDDGDHGEGCGVLRMDVGHLYEFDDVFSELLDAMLQPMHDLFSCGQMLTKAPSFAHQRQSALKAHGFRPAPGAVKDPDGQPLNDYWVHRA